MEGNTVEFTSRLNYMRWGVPYEHKGTIEGDTIKGTVEMGEYRSAPFVAKRKK